MYMCGGYNVFKLRSKSLSEDTLYISIDIMYA